MDVLEKEKPAAANGSPAPGTVAGGANGNPPGNSPVVPFAPQPGQPFGGSRGGKKRADGLPPGSPQAHEADRKRDAQRKKEARDAAAKLAVPPPLPAAGPGVAGSGASALPGGIPGAPGEAGTPAEQIILWDPELFKPLVKEAVDATEAARMKRCKETALEAKLGNDLIKEIVSDAQYVPAFKSTVNLTAPRVITKLLNRTGVSGKFSDEALCVLAMISIYVHGKRVDARVAELVEQKRVEEEKLKKAKETKA